MALALEHDVAFSMDVYNGTYTEEVGREQGYAEEFMRKNEETTDAQRTVFRKAIKAGVTLLFGTDLGVLPHDMGARQFEVMVRHGMAPMDAIKSATSVAAEHLGWAVATCLALPSRQEWNRRMSPPSACVSWAIKYSRMGTTNFRNLSNSSGGASHREYIKRNSFFLSRLPIATFYEVSDLQGYEKGQLLPVSATLYRGTNMIRLLKYTDTGSCFLKTTWGLQSLQRMYVS